MRLSEVYRLSILASFFLASCAQRDSVHRVVVSVADQAMNVYARNQVIGHYLVSTSKFGIGDSRGTYRTPLGRLEIAKKIGAGAPLGAVFKNRKPTGEVLVPDAPGRDPIVTRILWLKGLERENADAFGRYIYIHGTPEERNAISDALSALNVLRREIESRSHDTGSSKT